ncbi:dipeptidyl aminopeptidase/acylaminoacyl peptidase [Jatrophihabitans sp. GAS493]|uniref:S9 family peptidase n=1 Tax=Jatrophihabitans sp. GAS493 TaxID=1907575 RepID=UPI000BB95C5F|nr:prolyl oligopeptidase family serine peptidase [Jatrophihabitans sp. GAS493]SOD70857.1 dipeptidyl aminopeptidase/acylaminoacyl peptidase [Jatrophihabitans sp. GAS493]
MTTTSPYGSWHSPISAADLAAGEHPVDGSAFAGGAGGADVWWSELRSDEGGRYAVRRSGPDGQPIDVLPPPWNARTRVHEYGGAAWAVTADGVLVFAEFSDQRLYRLDPGSNQPRPLTPSSEQAALRYAEVQFDPAGREVRCIRETHRDGQVRRDLVAVPLDGSAATDPDQIRSIVAGSHFLAAARFSPDDSQLAWLAWDHPQMPWDGCELRVGRIDGDGRCTEWTTMLGSRTEAVLQPEWIDEQRLYVISDQTGWWNLYRLTQPAAGAGEAPRLEALCEMAADFGAPLWQFGARWYQALPDGRLLTVRTFGLDTLGILDPQTGELTDLDTGDLTTLRFGQLKGDEVLLRGGGARTPHGLRRYNLSTRQLTDVRLSVDGLPPAEYLPPSSAMTFHAADGREVHAFVYPPSNPDFAAPEGELPPFVALVHGGPTAHVAGMLNLGAAYFTSRGIGVVDVNYGGSSGYGRAYRERLRGQWGIVDVQDVVAAAQGLADAGLADGRRLAIQGGSAGGWTVLSALTQTDAFACGASYFGVAELLQFAEETHDFESRYLDGLIGPLPEARALYESRAPLNNVDGLSCPVLLLQGLDDPVVPPSQAERFRDALVAKGLPHAYLAYEGESHGFRKKETIVHSHEAELSFYGQVMGFVPADVPVLPLS